MTAQSSLAMEPAERVLVIERVFDAPRDLVFKAWTEPERVAQWWGPRGFKSTVLGKMDVRPGGSYRIHMRSPEGTDHWLKGRYHEVAVPERIVCTFEWLDADGNAARPETVLTVTFEDLGKKTKLTLHQSIFESESARDLHNQGWSGALDRLAEYVAAA
jgi:uncharacterized protein YndB with AHSA1/START domain